jgi:hypothetical protein
MASLGQLVLNLTTETAQFKRGLDQATKQANNNFNAMKNMAKTAGAAIAGFLTVDFAIQQARQFATLTAEIERFSKLTGTSAQAFQELSFASQRFGIQQDKVADILKDVSDKVGDFLQTGAGPMADFFENIAPRVGVTAEAFRNLNGQDALQLYVSSLEKANVSQNEMTFFMEAIASDATLLLPLFQNNASALNSMANEAQRLGAVLSDDAVAAGRAMDDEFKRLGMSAQGLTNQMADGLVPTITKSIAALTELMVAIQPVARFLGGAFAIAMQTVVGIGSDVVFVIKQMGLAAVAAADSLGKLASGDLSGAVTVWTQYNEQAQQARQNLDAFQRSLMNTKATSDSMQTDTGAGMGSIPAPRPVSSFGNAKQVEAAKKEREAFNAWLAADDKAQLDRQIKIIDMRINAEQQALREHADWIAQNEQATQDRLYEMQAKRLKEQEDLAAKTKEKYKELGEQIGSSIGNNLENAIMTGMKFKDVVRSIIQDMIRLAIQKTIVNSLTAGFGSFFGSMFGGGRALGGPVKAGTSYLVGERGPEVFTPMQSGNITPNGGGGRNSVVVNVNVDGGTKVQDDRGAGALGSAIAAAVRSELVNQRRPGGLLA